MTLDVFTQQLARLKVQYGENTYSNERAKLIYRGIHHMPDYWLEDSVNEFIANHRSAPLLKDFVEKINEHEERKKEEQNRSYNGMGRMGGMGIAGVVYQAAKLSTSEFVKKRVQLVMDHSAGKISLEQLLQGNEMIDRAAGIKTEKLDLEMAR